MNIFGYGLSVNAKALHRRSIRGLLFVACMLAGTRAVRAQAVESANDGHLFLNAGVGGSGFYLQYGAQNNVGITAWVDADTIRHFGVEGEARWLEWHQTANSHLETYLVGARYHFDAGRFQPYVKGLIGAGGFKSPATSSYGYYLVIAPGWGTDYHLGGRWSARADFEYQHWPQFTFGATNSVGGTVGIRYHIF